MGTGPTAKSELSHYLSSGRCETRSQPEVSSTTSHLSLPTWHLVLSPSGVTNPVVSLETPPGATANFVFTGLGLVMLVLSLRLRDPEVKH